MSLSENVVYLAHKKVAISMGKIMVGILNLNRCSHTNHSVVLNTSSFSNPAMIQIDSHIFGKGEITSRITITIIIIIIITITIIIVIIIQPCRGCLWTCQRFSKHLWPLQNQQKAGNRGCGSCQSTNFWGLEASPHCLVGKLHSSQVDHLTTGTSAERIVLRGVQKLGGCRLHQWCLRVRMTLFDTSDLVVTVCM